MAVRTLLVRWFYSFLSDRLSRVNGTLSEVRDSTPGVPRGCVSSPVNDCRSTYTDEICPLI